MMHMRAQGLGDEEVRAGAVARRLRAAVPGVHRGLGITVALAVIGAAGRLIMPFLVKRVIDNGIDADGADLAYVTRACTYALVAVVITQAGAHYAAYRLGRWSEDVMAALRRSAFARLMRVSLDRHAQARRGVLVARVTSDVETIARFFEWGAISLLTNGIVVLLMLSYLTWLDWRLALVAVLVSIPLIVMLRVLQRYLRRAYDEVRVHVGDALSRISELIAGAAVVRAYRAEEVLGEAAHVATRKRRDAQVRAQTIGALLFPSGEVTSILATGGVLLAALWVGTDDLTAGTVVAAVLTTFRLFEPVAEFTEVIDQTQLAIAGASRVLDVVEMPIDIVEPTTPVALPQGRLSVAITDVTYAYPPRPSDDATDVEGDADARVEDGNDEGFALRDVTLRIPPGTSLAVVGATGSGKSTLARLLVRFAEPQEGAIAIGGVPLASIADRELRSRVLLVPQEPFLFDTTIRENLSIAASGRTTPIGEPELFKAIEALGLESWLDGLPQGLETQVGERGSELSAGERQLVGLLRAQVADPDLLVLDEATSSVDPVTEARLSKTIEQLATGRTTVIIAHRLSTASRADAIAVMAAGRLVQFGRHAELVSADGPYARFVAEWESSIALA